MTLLHPIPTFYSVVVPIYKNEEFIPALIERCERLNQTLHGRLETVFVVDGSPDRSFQLLAQALPHARFNSRLIALSRNFGSFAAIRAGLAVAQGPYFTMMAADLQEPEHLILETFEALSTGEWDVVVGVRTARDDPWVSLVASRSFWWLYRKMVQREVPAGGIDMFGCSTVVRDALMTMSESNSTLVGLLVWLGFRRKNIGYRRLPRLFGTSAWSFRRKVKYLLDSTFAFSDLPIRLLTLVGALGTTVSAILGVVVVTLKLTGFIRVPGYAPLMLSIVCSTAILLFAMGILGGYIWRTFENTKRRPASVSMIDLSFRPSEDAP